MLLLTVITTIIPTPIPIHPNANQDQHFQDTVLSNDAFRIERNSEK